MSKTRWHTATETEHVSNKNKHQSRYNKWKYIHCSSEVRADKMCKKKITSKLSQTQNKVTNDYDTEMSCRIQKLSPRNVTAVTILTMGYSPKC